jgi:pimeloyl-ACP methyl ester carboxylesterase
MQPSFQPRLETAPTADEVSRSFRAPPQRMIDVGHSRLAYRRFGVGPDVVFVHGWPLHSATFRHVVARLSGQVTCHLIDLPGTGQTDWDDDAPIGLAAHAETLRAAVDELGLERYAMVAHDSGGAIARMLAGDDERVVGLVLGNTEIPEHTPGLVAFYALALRLPGGPAIFRMLMGRAAVRRSFLGFKGCFADPRYVEGEFRELFVDPILASRRALRGQLGLFRNLGELRTLREVNARVRVPVRLVWGELDRFFPLAEARPMLEQFGAPADLVVIEHAKLFAHEDFPDAFATATLSALRAWNHARAA